MDTQYELQTHALEEDHWWYRGRRRILAGVIDQLDLPAHARVLDAGCGSGRNMVELARLGEVTGIDLSPMSVAVARERGVGEAIEGEIDSLPFDDHSFDFAVCLDVIEHLEDDLEPLRELRRVVATGGTLLVTVPAYQWLWSSHDDINHHQRRYTRKTLVRAAQAAGWQTTRTTHFNSLLLPAAMGYRTFERLTSRPGPPHSDLDRTPAWLNRILEQPLNAEAFLIAHGGRIPVGLSLLGVFN